MSDGMPHEPTSTAQPPTRSRGDHPPPRPPHELPAAPAAERQFEHGGQQWVAWISGKSACGTGSYGLGLLEAVHFAAAGDPEKPLREALLARGRFDTLFDPELRRLLDGATPIMNGPDRP